MYLRKKVIISGFYFVSFFTISIFTLGCFKQKKFPTVNTNSTKIVVHSDLRSTRLCVLPLFQSDTEKNCKYSVENSPINCNLISSEASLFSLPSRDAADILIKGLTEVQLKSPGLGKKVDRMIVLQLETESSLQSIRERGTKDLETILSANKIRSTIQSLDRDTMNRLIHEMITKNFPQSPEEFLFIYSGESVLHATRSTSGQTKELLREDLGTLHLFEMGEKYRNSFFTCRQGISKDLTNTNSGWENFEACREYIRNRFEESGALKKLSLNREEKKTRIYLMGGIWDELSLFFKKKSITPDILKQGVRSTCKISTLELMRMNQSRNFSTKLCYHISYLDLLLEIFNSSEVQILPSKQILYSAGIYPEFSPECGNQSILPKK